MIEDQSLDTHPSTKKSHTQDRTVIQCSKCQQTMAAHFKRHVNRSKGVCDGAIARYFTLKHDGTMVELTVTQRSIRKSGTNDDYEKRRLYEEVAALKEQLTAT